MSTYTDANPLLKRYILLDLLEARERKAQGDDKSVAILLSSVRIRGKRLRDRGVDWRAHRPRSKKWDGTLGELYTSF